MANVSQYPNLFKLGALSGLNLTNRLILAPMTRTSAEADGRPTERMRDYYRDFARGGFSLLISEGIYTDERFSQGYDYQPGLANLAQQEAWQPIVESVQTEGAKFVAQLMHGGAQTQGNRFVEDTAAPSAVAPKGEMLGFYGGEGPYPTPRPMSEADIQEAIAGFAAAAQRAQAAGFDGVELHGANGYLIDQFISEYFNHRDDAWGGSLERRLAFPIAVIRAVRKAVGSDFLVGMRLSQIKVTDSNYRWAGREEAAIIMTTLEAEGLDYLHFSELDALTPAVEGTEKSLSALASELIDIPVIANGELGDPQAAETIIAQGAADFVAIGKAALANHDWPYRVRNNRSLATLDFAMLMPRANLSNEDAWREQHDVSATLDVTR
jgi:2,4-dienoyl-CoA reductase-like NADH-dependent reductase (Old Yellow Enzyme family)|nr:NADH:flavin oxidoreductase [uncultured Halomonas sp.]